MANVKQLITLETVKPLLLLLVDVQRRVHRSPLVQHMQPTWKQYRVDGVYTHGLGDTDTL